MLPGTRPLRPRSIQKLHSRQSERNAMWVATDLFRSRGAKHNRVLGADEYFVLDAHAKAVKVLRELRIGRDIHTYRR